MKGGATSFAILLLFSSASKSSSFLIISPHTTRWTSNRSKTHDVRSSENENENTESIEDANESVIGRRELLRKIFVAAAFKSIATRADDLSLLSPTVTSQKPAICDPTVESYRKGSHQIHIVGTAHISSESSRLSKEAVRQSKVKLILYMKSSLLYTLRILLMEHALHTQPDAVFIELDLQRITRAFRDGQVSRPITILFFTGEKSSGGGTIELQSAVLAPQNLSSKGITRLLEKLAPKNPIQEMYEGLEAQGITPGEEFVTAVEEGVNLGSLIILGDRRMDITMKRIANAIVFHPPDPKAMMEADRNISAKLKASIPELTQLDEQLKREGRRELTTEELAMFVERMKTKDITMGIMNEIKKAAPELHQALVGERDVYMARGMDVAFSSSLSSILPPQDVSRISHSSLQTMVAVVGLGHVSGVGTELKRLGWQKFIPSQC